MMMPARPPSVSEDTVEASATAMAEEMERVRDLPGDNDDMGEEELEELFRPWSGTWWRWRT